MLLTGLGLAERNETLGPAGDSKPSRSSSAERRTWIAAEVSIPSPMGADAVALHRHAHGGWLAHLLGIVTYPRARTTRNGTFAVSIHDNRIASVGH